MEYIITGRAFKSMQTRINNKQKQLLDQLPELYKKRDKLMNDIKFLHYIREDEYVLKTDIKELDNVRAGVIFKLVKLNMEITDICVQLKENHEKKLEYYQRYTGINPNKK